LAVSPAHKENVMSEQSPQAGDTAPDFTLPTWPEGELSLSGLRGKWIVLYFYPKDNTPGCTTESCAFRDASGNFDNAGAVILGISRDSVKSHANFAAKFDLPFRLVSDPDEIACKAFDVIRMKNMYGKQVMGVERSTFLIDPEGRIAHAWRKVKVDGHVGEVLTTLNRLRGA
jgi:thioredoxin-dependent peroxiredoxin